jgi:hypothetical protein
MDHQVVVSLLLQAEVKKMAAQCAASKASYQQLLASARAEIAAADATLRRMGVASMFVQSAAASPAIRRGRSRRTRKRGRQA